MSQHSSQENMYLEKVRKKQCWQCGRIWNSMSEEIELACPGCGADIDSFRATNKEDSVSDTKETWPILRDPEIRRGRRVIESMTRFTVFCWKIRVWREEASLAAKPDNADLEKAAWLAWEDASKLHSRDPLNVHVGNLLLLALEKLPRVNAVEVVDNNGNGHVLYPEWP